MRNALFALLLVIPFLVLPAPGFAVSDGEIANFVKRSDAFQKKLPRSRVLNLSAPQRRARAACILGNMEERHGSQGVGAVMQLMSVLSQGAEFDDPTIVSFNEAFGSDYDRIVAQCTRTASGS